MNKFLLVPDSFKGTISSGDICSVMRGVILNHCPGAEVVSIPVADGGEGSVDCFLAAAKGSKIFLNVKGPYMEDMESFYGLIDNGKTAVIEMAACAGLPLVGDNKHPDKTTTYGVGQLIAHAASRGVSKIIVGMGGSATNDLGAGCAAALGVKFTRADGSAFIPVGGTLGEIAHIDVSALNPGLKNVELITMFDIDNPLCGKTGAAYVYGPQKGANTAMVEFLDAQLERAAQVIKRDLGKDIAMMPGAGAAGGMGAGMVAFLNSTLKRGIETVLDAVDFDTLLNGADCVFTGEGKIDFQSLRGKVVIGVARRCAKKGVPVIAIVGDIDDGIESAYDEGVTAIISINRKAIPFSEARLRTKSDLELTTDNVMRLITRI